MINHVHGRAFSSMTAAALSEANAELIFFPNSFKTIFYSQSKFSIPRDIAGLFIKTN
jgi:hypothetical protein